MNNWESICPINTITSGFLVNVDFEFTAGIEIKLPPVFSMDRGTFKGLEDALSSSIKLLPDNTIYHQLDYIYTMENRESFDGDLDLVTRENKYIYHKKPVINTRTQIFLTFPPKLKRKKAEDSSLVRKKRYNVFNPLRVNTRVQDIEDYNFAVESFINALEGIEGVECKRMNNDQLGQALYRYLSADYRENFKNDEWMDKQLPVFNHESGDIVRLNDVNLGLVSLCGEGNMIESYKIPKTENKGVFDNGVDFDNQVNLTASFMYPITLGLPVDHIVSTSLQVVNTQDLDGIVTTEKRKISVLSSLGYPAAKNKMKDLNVFQDEISSENVRCCYLTQSTIITEKDPKKLKKYREIVRRGYENINGSHAYVENRENANLFIANCPGNISADYRYLMSTVDQGVCYLNKENPMPQDQDGHVYLDRPYGNPVVLDMFNSPKIENRNKIIIGPSGSGKSFWNNGYVNQGLNLNHDIILIDIGKSYRSNIKLYQDRIGGGKYIDAGDKQSLSFNPFLFSKKDGKYVLDEKESRKLTTLKTILTWIWKGENKIQKWEEDMLREVIIKYYDWINETGKFPCLHTFYDFTGVYEKQYQKPERKGYVDFEAMRLAFEKYLEGENKYLLNAENVLDIEKDRFVVFENEAVTNDPDLMGLLSLIIIDLVMDKIEKLPKGKRITFGIDEALDFLKNPIMGDFIAFMYRTVRKKDGEVLLAAQNVNFLKDVSQEIYNSITINSDTLIILDHTNYKSSYRDLQNVLSLTKHDIDLLDSVKKTKDWREFFIKMGNDSFVLRNMVSPFAQGVYTTKKSEQDQINSYYKYHNNLAVAIKEFVEQNNQ